MQNHTVERFWPEINSRVNYPIKACLVEMEHTNIFDMDAETHKFCVSWFTLRVATMGCSLCVKSWNSHSVPGTFKNIVFDPLVIQTWGQFLYTQAKGSQTDWH